MKILLSNDDGVYATGLKAMYQELKKLGKVWVVAPLEEKSTAGHSLTLHKPLRLVKTDNGFYGVSGSPADCVYVGIREVMKGEPDLVVSGINRGANLGQDVYYSGTVSAAREACILGIPSLAVSLAVHFDRNYAEEKLNYATAAKIAARLIKAKALQSVPKYTLLNLNVPDVAYKRVKGIATARQGFRQYSGMILKRKDHRGRPYYWVGGQYHGFKNDPDTDCFAVDHLYASLTPLKLDTTDFGLIKDLVKKYPALGKVIG